MADPTVGQVRIGCPESISAAILQTILENFTQQYPRVVLEVDTVNTLSFAQQLRERKLDVVLARGGWPLEDPQLLTDFNVETLYDDELVIVVGNNSPWARRRKIDIANLHGERWILTTGDRWNYQVISRAFAQRGLDVPSINIKTISVHLRANMVTTGQFITTFPRSVIDLYGDRFGLKVLPIELPDSNWPIKIATLKNRTLHPVVDRFIASAKSVASRPKANARKLSDDSTN